MSLSYRRRILRAGLESTPGTYVNPTLDIQYRKGTLNVDPLAGDVVERDVERGHLDTLGSLRAGDHAVIEFEVELAPSANSGEAPPWGLLMLGCGMIETEINSFSGTATNNGTDRTITLGAGSSGVDNYYVGCLIGGAGLGSALNRVFVVTAYDGSTKKCTLSPTPDATGQSATGTATIPGGFQYTPISSVFDSLSFDYLEAEEDSNACTLFKFKMARGEVTKTMNEKSIPVLKFRFLALLHSREDSTVPTLDYSAWGTPFVPNSAVTRVYEVHGYSAVIARQFEFMTGSAPVGSFRLNSEKIRITDRNPTGRLSMEAVLLADENLYAAIENRSLGTFAMSHGTAFRGRVIFLAKAPQIRSKTPPEDVDKIVYTTLDFGFRAFSSAGNDSFFITCYTP